MGKRVLVITRHGLGDATQATIILKHLAYHRPDWIVDIESLWGKHSLYHGLCNQTFTLDQAKRKNYDKVFDLGWWEPGNGDHCGNSPLTKVTVCLRNELHLDPVPELYYYSVNIQQESVDRVNEYLSHLPQKEKIVGIHYQGNTSSWQKDIGGNAVERLCRMLISEGYIVLILDWDGRSSLPNGETIFCPGKKNPIWQGKGTGDGNTIAALIEKLDLFVGIDSGPAHIAGATTTPTVVVWRDMHPLNFFDLSYNCTHLLSPDTKRCLRAANTKVAQAYFHKTYQHVYYDNLDIVLRQTVAERLSAIRPTEKAIIPSALFMTVRKGRWWQLDGNLKTIKEVDVKLK